jgi:4-amino-4-deoxy-L-arabinose transferase-like glycosyltransferase
LKSGDTYELAVMSAYCFLMGGSYLMLRALQAERRRPLLFVLAGLCFGLSVGGRPNYAVGVVLLVGLIAAAMLRLVKTVSISKGDFGYFAAPVVACGLCLAAYNYARFDNPLEFGFQYQLTDEPGMNQFHFHPRNLMYGVFYQMFSLPAFSRSLPFVHAQIQRLGSDHVPPGMILYPVVGVLAAMPLVLVGLLPFPGALAWRLSSPSNGAERLVVVVLLLVAGANFLVISAMGSYCVRYGVDFAPSLVLVAFVSLAFWLNGSGARYRKAAAIGVNIVVLVCACEGALLALSGGTGTNQTFLAHPKLFLRGVALINHITGGQTPPPSAAVDLQASIVFSDAPSDLMEPILTSGHAGMVTFIGVRYPHSGQVQFYYQHLQRLADFGKVVAISAGRPYSLDVRIDPDNSSVTIALDNAIVYQRRVPLYPIPLDEIVAGQNPVWSPGRAKFFSGKLEVRHFSATPSMLWRTDEPPVPPVTAPQ